MMNTDLKECAAFVAHLRKEHQHLHQAIQDVLEAEQIQFHEFRKRLVRLRDELARHFQEEEEGGCLEEAVARCPALAEEVERLLLDHGKLLQDMDTLIEQHACSGCSDGSWHAAFVRLTKDLLTHESAEDDILRRAFGEPVD